MTLCSDPIGGSSSIDGSAWMAWITQSGDGQSSSVVSRWNMRRYRHCQHQDTVRNPGICSAISVAARRRPGAGVSVWCKLSRYRHPLSSVLLPVRCTRRLAYRPTLSRPAGASKQAVVYTSDDGCPPCCRLCAMLMASWPALSAQALGQILRSFVDH